MSVIEERVNWLAWTATAGVLAIFLYAASFDGAFFTREIFLAATGVLAILGMALLINWDRIEIPSGSGAPMIALFGIAAWTLATTLWSIAPNLSLIEFGRISIYLAVFIAILTGPPGRKAVYITVSLFVASVTGLALFALMAKVSPALSQSYLYSGGRLMGSVGYWNGLAALMIMAILPSVWLASSRSISWLGRLAATLSLTISGLALFFTLSRGGLLVAAGAIALYLLLNRERLGALASLLSALIPGGIFAWYASTSLPTLQTAATGDRISAADGHHFAIGLAAVLVAALAMRGASLLLPTSLPRTRKTMLLAGAVIGLAALVVAGGAFIERHHIVNKLHSLQSETSAPVYDYNQKQIDAQGVARLVSTSNNRLEFWRIGLTNFQNHPLIGTGGGTFRFPDAQLRSILGGARDPHSIWVRFLSDQGIIGFGLLLIFLGSLAWVFARQALASKGLFRDGLFLALVIACLAWLADSSFEWNWALPAVAIPFFLLAALALRLGSTGEPGTAEPEAGVPGHRVAALPDSIYLANWLKWAIVAASMTLTIAFLVLLFSDVVGQRASARLAEGNLSAARSAAETAHRLNYLDPGPMVTLSGISEKEGNFTAARNYMERALHREPQDSAFEEDLALIEFYDLKETGQGLIDYNKAVNLDPQYEPLHIQFQKMYADSMKYDKTGIMPAKPQPA